MIGAYEAAHDRWGGDSHGGRLHTEGGSFVFDTVVRLRPDTYWEARVSMAAELRSYTLYTPFMESDLRVNDHLAFGDRRAARHLQLYLLSCTYLAHSFMDLP
jgi:hypothetical protein